MPPVVAAAITAAAINAGIAGSLIAAQIIYAAAYIATSAVLSFAANLVLGALAKPKSPGSGAGGFIDTASNRTVTVKQPVEQWHIVYGSIRKAGVYTQIDVSGKNGDNRYLHLIITLAGHQVERIGDLYFDAVRVPLSGSGTLTPSSGKYEGFVLVEKRQGTPDQTSFPNMTSLSSTWTTDHRQADRAVVHVRLRYDDDVFANGVPGISFDIDGKKVFDPREPQVQITGSQAYTPGQVVVNTTVPHNAVPGDRVFIYGHTQSTLNLNGEHYVHAALTPTQLAIDIGPTNELGNQGFGGYLSIMHFSSNTDLCIADYLMNKEFGKKFDFGSEIDEDSLIAAANIDDEMVELKLDATSTHQFTVKSNLLIASSDKFKSFVTGNKVTVSGSQGLASPLNDTTDYFWVSRGFDRGYLALSLEDAYRGNAITISNSSSSGMTVTRAAEARYTVNGTLKTNVRPIDVIQDMLTSNGGKMTYVGGRWKFFPAAYRPPVVELDDDDLRASGYKVVTLTTARDAFNGVKGVFSSPENLWQPSDFPSVQEPFYVDMDGGEETFKEVEYSWTVSSSAAQRISRIDLRKARQEISIPIFPSKLRTYKVEPADTVMISNASYGWDRKVFDVLSVELVTEASEDNAAPSFGVNLSLQETAPEIYEWIPDDELTRDPAPNSNLPDPTVVAAPINPQVTEELYTTVQSSGVKARAIFSWEPSDDAFVISYQPEFKLSSVTDWQLLPITRGLQSTIDDVNPGIYDFRVSATNVIGSRSEEFAEVTAEILGLAAPPSPPANLTLSKLGGIALLQWDVSTDLDVTIGGQVDFRHVSEGDLVSLPNSVTIGARQPGNTTFAPLPLRPGTYMVRFVDSSGVPSTAVQASTDGAQVLSFSTTGSLTEHPTFPGVKSGTVVDVAALTLSRDSEIDDVMDVDAIADWDNQGEIVSSGTYDFSAFIDLGSVKTVRVRPTIVSTIVNEDDDFDARPGNVDDLLDWDGEVGSDADAVLWVATSDEAASPTPTFGPFSRVDSSEIRARTLKFQLRLKTDTNPFNIRVRNLSVDTEEVS